MIILVNKLREKSLEKRNAIGNKFLDEVVSTEGKLHWYTKGTFDEFVIPENVVAKIKEIENE
ncbi:hypothetical protein BN4901_2790 [Citrobacter europaeus]|uniref:Uncharacterized protein n=2 Tax=Citrobacter europaeus TaxID=1914243 RepID=A0ABY0JQM3_9ENTR|nr:hypothetical protein BN4901_2790 [Citrobacter europaeus]